VKRAAIVGGGIGGLTTAIALRKIGFDAHVYERTAVLKEAGSGMSIWQNALASLEQIDPRVLSRFTTNDRSLRRLLIKQANGGLVKSVRLSQTNLGGLAIHRAELQSALADAVPAGSIHMDHAFLRLETLPHSVRLYFANGAITEVDLVVGCDGVHSSIRQALGLDCTLTNRPYCVWRGISRLDSTSDMWQLGLCEDGDFSESYGRGQKFGILRIGEGRIHWYAVANNSRFRPDQSERANLLRLFSGWHTPIQQLIEDAESILRSRVQDRLTSLPWTKGRVATLGDAAHPITPNFGQGACLAIEDAVVLAASLKSEHDIPNALRRYERARYRRCLEISLASREVGRLAQLQNRMLVAMRDYSIRLAPSAFTTFWFRRSCDFQPPSLATC
jgi:2-polyprenyl-6-methoxyphenol hydroxylase-like FAD-dependent oxidoreductase